MKSTTRLAKHELENLNTRKAFVACRKKLIDKGYKEEHDSDYVIARMKVETAETALEQLSSEERRLVTERYINAEPTPISVLAKSIGKSESTTNRLIYKALKKFALVVFGTDMEVEE